jgi:Zn-finger protein
MLCSNPNCRKLTSGPRSDPNKSVRIGVAAHITAASPGGPRYDKSLSQRERSSAANGIWLCQNCAKLVDNDAVQYTVELLRSWKGISEKSALRRVEGLSNRRKLNTSLVHHHGLLERIKCPTCRKIVEQVVDKMVGSSATPVCQTCGRFHVTRDREGTLVVRRWGGTLKKRFITCPKCANKLAVRKDIKKPYFKPCLDCESLLRVHSLGITATPLSAIQAGGFTKESNGMQLLSCPNCHGVKAMTLGANKHQMLFAQCPKCRVFLKHPSPIFPCNEKEEGTPKRSRPVKRGSRRRRVGGDST